jgi:hypothetical protein
LEHPFIRQLASVAAGAPSADNSQPWQLAWDGVSLSLHFAARAGALFQSDSHASLLAAGAVAEHVQAALDANGVTGRWQLGGPDGRPYASVALASLPASFQAPAGPAARHTNRLPYRRQPLPADLAARLAAMGEGGNRLHLLQGAAARPLIDMVRSCSEARFCTPQLHAWLFDCLRFTPQEAAGGSGLDVRTLGLPPGGRALMHAIRDWRRMEKLNRFGLYKLMALAETGLLRQAPGLLCISGPAGWPGSYAAGRLLARVWMALNLEGLAVHPYYVISDQLQRLHAGSLPPGFAPAVTAVEQALQDLLGLAPGQTLHMLLRIGWPQAQPVRSQRLPLEQVFSAAAGGAPSGSAP